MATVEQLEGRQKAFAKKEEIICSDFRKLRDEYPNVSICAIFDTLAERYRRNDMNVCGAAFPTTGQQIRNIIIKHGLYTPRKYQKQ